MEKKTLLFYFLLIAGFFVLLYMILSSKILENLDIFSHVNVSPVPCIFNDHSSMSP